MEDATRPPQHMTAAAEALYEQIQDAFTRDEIEAAEAALREHLAAHPEDDAPYRFHGFRVAAACLREREAQARLLGYTDEEQREREQLLKSTRIVVDPAGDPGGLDRLAGAGEALEQWLARHPDDVAVRAQLQGLRGSQALAREVIEALREMESGPGETGGDPTAPRAG